MAEAAERYKQYAAECLRIAQQANDGAQKARLLEMAEACGVEGLRTSNPDELAAAAIVQWLAKHLV